MMSGASSEGDSGDDELALADAFLESLKSAGINIVEKKRFSLLNSDSESDGEPPSSRIDETPTNRIDKSPSAQIEPPPFSQTTGPPTSTDHHKPSGQIPSDDDTAAEERPVARLNPTESPPDDPDDPDWQPEEDDNRMNDDEPPDDDEPEEHDIVENGLSSADRVVSGNAGKTNLRPEEPRNQPIQRKRKAEPMSWFDNKNKALRESGKPYVGWIKPAKDATSRRGCPRPERRIGPPCISPVCEASQKRFCSGFSADQRDRTFQKFWTEMTWDQRKVYISSLIRTSSVKRSRSNSDEGSRRNVSLQYFLKKDDASSYAVCKKMFLSTFGLKEKQVYNWAKEGSVNSGMARPSYKEIKGRTRPERPDFVWLKKFLDSLAKLPSHYCRKSTAKVYLEPVFGSDTMAAVYRAYAEACTNNDRMVLSRHTFSKVAKAINIGFQLPKKDKCDLCCSYEAGNWSKEERDAHEADKEEARKQKAEDKKRSEANEITMLTMDLMAVKVAPFLNASSLYFKTKLCVHNFSVFDCGTKNTHCYWFGESQCDLTADTFASLIVDYLLKNADFSKDIIIWSDNCGYQNKCAAVSNALLILSHQKNVTIYQKYLKKGHTQMEVDSVHACIERTLKNKSIFLPSDYLKITIDSRKEPPYQASMVGYEVPKKFSSPLLMRYSSIRPGKRAGDLTVSDIKAIKYVPEGKIFVQTDFEGPFIEKGE